MRKWIVLGVVLAALVGAVLVAAANLDRWLDENRGLVEAQASAALAREVRIGDLDVSLWGGLGVRVSDLRVAEDPAWGEGDFLILEEALVRVAFWPALFGRIELSEVVFQAPQIRVLRDERGLSTDSLAASEELIEEEVEEEAEPLDLAVTSLRIENGRLVFEDRSDEEPVVLAIERLDAVISDIDPRDPLVFELQASLLGAEEHNLEAKGSVGPVLGEGAGPMAFDIELSLDPVSMDTLVQLEEVVAAMGPDTRASGDLVLEAVLRGNPENFEFELVVDATEMDLAMDPDFVKPMGTPFGLDARGRVTPTEALVDAFSFGLERARFEGDARVGLSDTSPFDVRLRSDDLSLEDWGPLLPAFEGMPVEGRLSLDVRAKGSAASEALPLLDGRLSLSGVSVRLPDTPAVEKLELETVFSGRAASVREGRLEVGGAPVRFEADIDDLNAPQARFALDSAEFPLAALGLFEPGTEADHVLRDLRVVGQADLRDDLMVADARFASPRGRLQGIDYDSLEGRARTEGTRMELEDMKVQMLGGDVRLSGAFDAGDPENPDFNGAMKLANIEIGEVVRTQLPLLAGVASGRLDTSMNLSGKGLAVETILQTLTGGGSIEIDEGVLQGVNIAEEVLSGATGIPGLSSWASPKMKERHPALFASSDTRFESMRAGLQVENGRLNTENLSIVTDDFGLTGVGSIGLDGSLQLNTEFRTSAALATSLVGVASPTRYLLDDQKRLVIPVRITGGIANPSIKPDQGYLTSALKKATVGAVGSFVSGLIGGTSSPAPSQGEGSPALPSASGEEEPPAVPGPSSTSAPEASGEDEKPSEVPAPTTVDDAVQQGLDNLFGR